MTLSTKYNLNEMTVDEILELNEIEEPQEIYVIEYRGFLQQVRREFETYEKAVAWLQVIGRDNLVKNITKE